MLHALAGERRAAAAGCDTRDAIDALAQAMGVEMQRAGQELVRVDELLEHANDQLIEAFNGVSDYLQRQELMQAGEVDLF